MLNKGEEQGDHKGAISQKKNKPIFTYLEPTMCPSTCYKLCRWERKEQEPKESDPEQLY